MSPPGHELLLLSADTREALDGMTGRLAEHLATAPDTPLGDVARTLQTGRLTGDHRRMLVAQDAADAAAALSTAISMPGGNRVLTGERRTRGRAVAFMFPGVGDHYPGMARDLYRAAPAFRHAFDRCAEIILEHNGADPRRLLFDTPAPRRDAPTIDFWAMVGRGAAPVATPAASALRETRLAQPIVYAVDYAVGELLASFGIRPAAVIGYSLGDYVAATFAGVLSMRDALTLVCRRAALIQRQPRGAMMAVALSAAETTDRLPAGVDLAIVNGDDAVVVAGSIDAVENFRLRLERQGVACRPIDTTHAFHSRRLDAAAPALTNLVAEYPLGVPRIPIVSGPTGDWLTPAEARDPGYWARHMSGTIRFARGLETLLAAPDMILLEVGPGQSLGAFAKQHPRTDAARIAAIHSTLPSAHVRRSDHAFFLTTLGRLWLDGVDVDFAAAQAGDGRRPVWLPLDPPALSSSVPVPRDAARPIDPADRRDRRRLALRLPS